MSKDEINIGKEDAKKPFICYKFKVDGYGNLWWYYDNEWEKMVSKAKDKAFFCKCGYYSLNYKDFCWILILITLTTYLIK